MSSAYKSTDESNRRNISTRSSLYFFCPTKEAQLSALEINYFLKACPLVEQRKSTANLQRRVFSGRTLFDSLRAQEVFAQFKRISCGKREKSIIYRACLNLFNEITELLICKNVLAGAGQRKSNIYLLHRQISALGSSPRRNQAPVAPIYADVRLVHV